MNRLDELTNDMADRALDFLHDLRDNDIAVAVVETYRPQKVQDAFFAQGREPLEKVNALRAEAGLGPINAATNKQQITRATLSKHTKREAMDVVPIRPNGEWDWDTRSPTAIARWLVIGETARRHGLRWGGDWKDNPTDVLGWDCPHVEFDHDWKEAADAAQKGV